MNLKELTTLMDRHGKDATLAQVATASPADEAATLFGAMGQRMIPVPRSYDHQGRAAECQCGLLLEKLPRSTTLERVVVVLGTPRRVAYTMTHAHIAPGLCSRCYDGTPCIEHPAVMCDTPTPELCGRCGAAPSAMGRQLCHDCHHADRVAELAACGEFDWEAAAADRNHGE